MLRPTLHNFRYGLAIRKTVLRKLFIMPFLMLVVAAPTLAKSRDVYPVSCEDLWAAVKHTLESPRDYGVVSMSDVEQKASFTIIGNLTLYTDKIALPAKDGGCAMKATFLQEGPDDSDWRQFHHRLDRSLARLQAAKLKPAVTSPGQEQYGRSWAPQ